MADDLEDRFGSYRERLLASCRIEQEFVQDEMIAEEVSLCK